MAIELRLPKKDAETARVRTALDERVKAVSEQLTIQVEQYVKLYIRPKPWWLPRWLWRRLITPLAELQVSPLEAKMKERDA